VYPGCCDSDGNPRLTGDTICRPCRRRYRRTIDGLVLNYVTLRATMPKAPIRGERDTQTSRTAREPGHPAQWASDTCRAIADALDEASDSLRDHLGHLPPPPRTNAEGRRVDHAHATLVSRFDNLCAYPGADATAHELHDLSSKVAWGLGHGNARQALPTPCPDCGIVPVFRTIRVNRTDSIECDACGRTISEEHYGLYTRIIVGELIAAVDTDNATGAAS
jgi:hypothetical protein